MTFSPIGHEEWGPALAAKIKFSAACPMNVASLVSRMSLSCFDLESLYKPRCTVIIFSGLLAAGAGKLSHELECRNLILGC